METTLFIPVRDAEPVVKRWRVQHDPSATAGIPAHVTLVHPFLEEIPDHVVDELSELFAVEEPWPTTFADLRRFPGEVLWLAPDPAEPFLRLTQTVCARYDLRPYGGEHGDPVPHLTVGHGPREALDEVARYLEPMLPVRAVVREAVVMERPPGAKRWTTRSRFPFLGRRAA